MLEGTHLQEGKMKEPIVISGISGSGKSSIASSLAVSLALQGLDVLYVNTEESENTLKERLSNIERVINSKHLGVMYHVTLDSVDELQELVVGNIYDYVIIDQPENIEAYEQLNTDYDNKTKIIEIRRV